MCGFPRLARHCLSAAQLPAPGTRGAAQGGGAQASSSRGPFLDLPILWLTGGQPGDPGHQGPGGSQGTAREGEKSCPVVRKPDKFCLARQPQPASQGRATQRARAPRGRGGVPPHPRPPATRTQTPEEHSLQPPASPPPHCPSLHHKEGLRRCPIQRSLGGRGTECDVGAWMGPGQKRRRRRRTKETEQGVAVVSSHRPMRADLL